MSVLFVLAFFFFFKQKTAYEMRISDWSSDVCSSDLIGRPVTTCDQVPQHGPSARPERAGAILREAFLFLPLRATSRRLCAVARYQIGRASCRDRVCQYV